MKRIVSLMLVAVLATGLFGGCHRSENSPENPDKAASVPSADEQSFGADLTELGAYDGYFTEDVADVTVTCLSGPDGCYELADGVLRFSALSADAVYAISGRLKGRVEIDIGDDYRLDLELQGLSLVSDSDNPVTVLSGKKVSLTAKAGFANYLYDTRAAVDPTDESVHTAAVYSTVDLEVCGKGALTLVCENNNGIHSKKDLVVKNATLLVACVKNALKGNDSVTLESGTTTLIATQGDGIKTTDSDLSDKGNQRGTVTICGGTHTVYAGGDGIDAAYDAVIEGEDTSLTVYTDKYSNYTATTDNSATAATDSAETDTTAVPGQKAGMGGGMGNTGGGMGRDPGNRENIGDPPDGTGMPDNLGNLPQNPGEMGDLPENMGDRPDGMTPPDGMGDLPDNTGDLPEDMTPPENMGNAGGMGGGMGNFGGMTDGNTDKSDRSTKGIKAQNAITVAGGTVTVKSYDDALHANGDRTLDNGSTSAGDVTVAGGTVTVYSNDDGLHADGHLQITDGTVTVTYSYEGLEGNRVTVAGGVVSVQATDDGINGVATDGTSVEISGGTVYIHCTGDGIDSNSRTAYQGIVFSGGQTVIFANSSGDSAIDTEQGYAFTGGRVLAVMPSRGMTSEATHCQNFSSVGVNRTLSLTAAQALTVTVDGQTVVTATVPDTLSAAVIYLGRSDAQVATAASTDATLDANGVCWSET